MSNNEKPYENELKYTKTTYLKEFGNLGINNKNFNYVYNADINCLLSYGLLLLWKKNTGKEPPSVRPISADNKNTSAYVAGKVMLFRSGYDVRTALRALSFDTYDKTSTPLKYSIEYSAQKFDPFMYYSDGQNFFKVQEKKIVKVQKTKK